MSAENARLSAAFADANRGLNRACEKIVTAARATGFEPDDDCAAIKAKITARIRAEQRHLEPYLDEARRENGKLRLAMSQLATELAEANDRLDDLRDQIKHGIGIAKPAEPVRGHINNYHLCEAVADLACNFAHAEFTPDDSRELPRLCIEWAQDFEAEHAGREWDGEYIEAIDAYFAKRYDAWCASAAPYQINPWR